MEYRLSITIDCNLTVHRWKCTVHRTWPLSTRSVEFSSYRLSIRLGYRLSICSLSFINVIRIVYRYGQTAPRPVAGDVITLPIGEGGGGDEARARIRSVGGTLFKRYRKNYKKKTHRLLPMSLNKRY